MITILFVCQWNIGRSQIAQAFVNHFYGDKYLAISAGIDDVGYKYNYKCYPPIVAQMQEKYGIDMWEQRPKPLTPEMIDEADEVHVLCTEEECYHWFPAYLKASQKVIYSSVVDPNQKSRWEIADVIEAISVYVDEQCASPVIDADTLS